jgi:hypothetical protein
MRHRAERHQRAQGELCRVTLPARVSWLGLLRESAAGASFLVRPQIELSGPDWRCTVRSDHPAIKARPPKVVKPGTPASDQRVWFPPAFQDFEIAMEVTAYAGRR